MNNKLKTQLLQIGFLVLYLPLFGLLSVYFLNRVNTGRRQFSGSSSEGTGEITINNNGNEILTGGVIATGVIIDIPYEETSDEKDYIKNKDAGNFARFSPQKQEYMQGGYNEKTKIMTNYLSNNTFQFTLPNNIKNGYLYIRLKKATDAGVFVYRHGSNISGNKISGNIDKTKTLISGSDTEFLYKLDKIPYERFYDKKMDTYNWLNQMKLGTSSNFIAGFVRDYDGSNKIEEITIAWE